MPRDQEGPRLEGMERSARGIADAIAQALPPGIVFALWLGDANRDGFATYVSNANREDMRRAVGEWLERVGGEIHDAECPRAEPCTCASRRPS